FAEHTADLVKTLSVNSSVSLNAYVGTGEIGLGFIDQRKVHSTNLTFVFTKTRNFGTTVYPALRFSPLNGNFTYDVPNWMTYLQGEALDTQITRRYGTHYVAGFQKAAWVWVSYTFNYNSTAVKQQLSVSASGRSWDFASVSTFVQSYFKSSNSTMSITCDTKSSSTNAANPPPSC